MTVATYIQQPTNLMYWLRNSSRTLRFAASIVLITFNMLILSPTLHAIQDNPIQLSESTNPEADLSTAFEQIIAQLDVLKEARKNDQDTTVILANLKDLSNKVASLDVAVMDNFHKLEVDLIAKQLPAVLLQRHTDMVMHYQAQRDAWLERLESETGTGFFVGLLRSTKDWMGITPVTEKVISPLSPKDPRQFKRKQQPFNPNEMSNRSLKPNKDNVPKVNKDEFTQAGLHSTPYTKLAALGDFTFDQLAGASDPVYLAESDEITLSQVIKDKAAELNFDPIKIHHFVRNNIEWVPSWGAIQNADLTLSAQRGNAMDISSLTIALLRASQIPSRYVHGTIDVPRDRFLNWAGGFTDINAAMTFAASAGIPVTPVVSSGQVSKVRIEHVWVEAAIDYFPSRGAKNRDADAWVQFDPSYKQYEYLERVDAVAVSGINAETLIQSFIDSGNINETEGSTINLDPSIIAQAHFQAQQMLEEYITNNISMPLVEDVIGGRKTITKEYPILPSSLPNRIVIEGARYDKLPSSLQQTIGWAFERDILGEVIGAVTFPMATVNNEKITLSFKPATELDEQALAMLLPEGEITSINQLPDVPSHLVSVIPELKVNGVVKKVGAPMRMGEELDFITVVKLPQRTQPVRAYKVVAGSFLSVNAIAQSVSSEKLTSLLASIEQTRLLIERNDPLEISRLTREQVIGDIFYAGSLGYYAQLIATSEVSGLEKGAYFHLAAGIGTVGFEPNVDYFFGIPRSVKAGGAALDIPYIQVSQAQDGNNEKLKQFNLIVGRLASGLEHSVPEQMFNINPSNLSGAISTVKALRIANSLGQRIYEITQANMDLALPNIHHDIDTMNEIRASLNAGKIVLTHTDAVSLSGWTGAGYAILDPETNVGAWKISGGTNGGFYALGYIINTLTIFFDFLDSLSSTLGKVIPQIRLVSRMLQVARFMQNALEQGADCIGDLSPVVIFTTLFTIMALLIAQFVTFVVNPLAAFVVGIALDFALDGLISVANNCK